MDKYGDTTTAERKISEASEVCVEVAGPVPGPRGPRKGFRLESICWD